MSKSQINHVGYNQRESQYPCLIAMRILKCTDVLEQLRCKVGNIFLFVSSGHELIFNMFEYVNLPTYLLIFTTRWTYNKEAYGCKF